ncbi:hypothetical protein Bca4012_099081 [Brassica carinata]
MSDCLNAQLCRDGPACISVSGNLAELLDEELVMSSVEPKVAVATNINPKLVGGTVFDSNGNNIRRTKILEIEFVNLVSLNERRMEETERRDGFNRDDMDEFNEAWSTEGLSPE